MQVRVKFVFCTKLSRYSAALALLLLASMAAVAQTQTPVISGGVGFLSTTNAGFTFLQPVIAPVGLLPLGDHVLIESRADLRGFIAPKNGNGPYEGQFFPTLEYLQADFLVNSRLTIVAGRFLTPFNIYNERLTPIWIRNFEDAPIIFPIGTRTSGSSDGVMVRGTAAEGQGWQVNYTAYFSALSNVDQFASGRAAGGRAGVFLPNARLEVGVSYQRFLQDQHIDAYGAYLSWQPAPVPVDVRSEYAQSRRGHGYWVEAAYRFHQPGQGERWYAGFQPMFRMQQFLRGTPAPGDSLPAAGTQQADFGLNYNFAHNVRVNSSYSRNFSGLGNSNIWSAGVTYRFLIPLLPGGKS